MPRYCLSPAPSNWPGGLTARLDKAVADLPVTQRARLRQAFGRWLLAAQREGLPPDHVTRALWLARSEGASPTMKGAMRQAVGAVWPHALAELHPARTERAPRGDPRSALAAQIDRALAKCPEAFRIRARPLLHVDPDGVDDGILIRAQAASTVKRGMEAAVRHFDFCLRWEMPPVVSRASVAAELQEWQAMARRDAARIGGAQAHVDALLGLVARVEPERDWRWLRTTRDGLKKLAKHHPSRNASRVVDAAKLRAAGITLMERALADHHAARNHRQRILAHTLARTALTMVLLSEAPIRRKTVVELTLAGDLAENLATIHLAAHQTKEREEDKRALSGALVAALTQYIGVHRAVVAPAGENRLLLGDDGAPIEGQTVTSCLGATTEAIFRRRVTPQAVRHGVACWIAATVPEQAALAQTILHHRRAATTTIYLRAADQIAASKHLCAASTAAAAALHAGSQRRGRKPAAGRPQSQRARLAGV